MMIKVCNALFLAALSFSLFGGVLPTGYARLAYIESDGTQYIDTLHHPDRTTAVEIDFELTTTAPVQGERYCILFGAGNDTAVTSENNYFGFFAWPGDANTTWAIQCGTQSIRLESRLADTAHHTVSIKAGEQLLDGELIGTEPGIARRIKHSIYLFAQHNNWATGEKQGLCKMKLHSFRICEGGQIVMDFYPAKNNQGVVGLYERMTGRFCTKGQGNDFIAGDEIADVDPVLPDMPTVQIACQLATDGRSADFTFAPSSEDRELFVAYGPTDAGNDLDSWAHYDKVADVPANAERLAGVSLPTAFGAENKVLRAVVKATLSKTSASGYVHAKDLLAQWDGVENAGLGDPHDVNASKPTELRGGIETTLTGTMAAGEKSFTLGNGYLHFQSQKIVDAINAGHATVELVMEPNGSLVHNGGLFCAGNTSRGFWIYQQTPGLIGALSYHAAMSGDFCQVEEQSSLKPGSGFPCPRTFTSVLATTREASFLSDNGVKLRMLASSGNVAVTSYEPNIYRHAVDCADANCYIGILPGNWLSSSLKATAKVYSIRVYNRVLTADEIAENTAIDKARFNGVQYNEFSAVQYFPVPLTVEFAKSADGELTGAELVFAGSERARELYLVCARRDQGAQQEGWTSRRCVTTIPAGAQAATVEFTDNERDLFLAGGGCRFFLAEPTFTADDYAATDDLLAQFDGIENLTFGIHDAYANNPRDLRNATRRIATDKAIPALDNAFTIGGDGGYMTFDFTEFMNRVNAGDATVELVLAPNGTAKHNGGIFCLGGANATTQRGFWLYQHNDTAKGQFMFSAVTYHGQNGNFDGLWAGSWSDGTACTWTSLLNSGSMDSSLNKNGEFVQAFTRYSVEATDPTCYIGILPGTYISSNYRANAKVHSIRVYNRKLTADELARNARVDVQRFRGEVLAQTFSDYQRLRRGLIIVFGQ